ncbi:hypothetical protein AVEN_141300-1 [Araneus ventricosus]|uniref:Uncharacterized protein n=1 Tax=Araneus ventricosus TaxID=182803 RepID=A0A4Y2EGY7_ARAVE|nr:hypothetical protein AVEN_141300-1 [Araneus ventricosus]
MSEKRRPFRTPLRRGNKKSAGARFVEYGGCSRTITLRVARKFLTRTAVCGRSRGAVSTVTLVQLRPNPPDELQQPFQNSLIGFRVDGCTRG